MDQAWELIDELNERSPNGTWGGRTHFAWAMRLAQKWGALLMPATRVALATVDCSELTLGDIERLIEEAASRIKTN